MLSIKIQLVDYTQIYIGIRNSPKAKFSLKISGQYNHILKNITVYYMFQSSSIKILLDIILNIMFLISLISSFQLII